MEYADLHFHSLVSDGAHNIDELVKIILEEHKNGLNAVALTDHDIYSDEIEDLHDALRGNGYSGLFIPGVEFTTKFNGADVHTLAYAPNLNSPGYEKFNATLKANRDGKREIWKDYLQKLSRVSFVRDGDFLIARYDNDGKQINLESLDLKEALDVGLLKERITEPEQMTKYLTINYRDIEEHKEDNNYRRPTEVADLTLVMAKKLFGNGSVEAQARAYEWVYKTFFTRGTPLNLLKAKSPEQVAGRGKPYVSTIDAINIINNADAVSVIAHPGAYGFENVAEREIPLWANEGLQGVEVRYPSHTIEMEKKYIDIARKKGMLITGGTDFHGNRGQEVLPENLQEETGRRYATIGEVVLKDTDHISRVPMDYALSLVNRLHSIQSGIKRDGSRNRQQKIHSFIHDNYQKI